MKILFHASGLGTSLTTNFCNRRQGVNREKQLSTNQNETALIGHKAIACQKSMSHKEKL